jgi:pseudouridine-5'-phosphate glycosidase
MMGLVPPAPPNRRAVTVSRQVTEALDAGRPVVALESTIITHGLPYPSNLETALAVEDVVRASGAVPATVAVLDGRPAVGLEGPALEKLAAGEGVLKASRRDLGPVVAARRSAGTTVAATMYVAHLAGIGIFATGGIGGVHRDAGTTFDVSADLQELARTPVTVVSAGAKSILDLPKTLEMLETLGVPVIGFGTDEFPAFFSRTSGLPVEHRVDTPEQLAAVILAHRALSQPGGILVANPVPAEQALDGDEIDAAIDQAVADAQRAGITGHDLTPYLLARIVDLSAGRSLAANVALVRNNAALAARTAVALAQSEEAAPAGAPGV